jgi:hypothetical protein
VADKLPPVVGTLNLETFKDWKENKMSDKRYYSVQITQKIEVCILAEDEGDAERIARENGGEFDWVMADIDDATAEEMYNEPDDASLVKEFKDEGRYAE